MIINDGYAEGNDKDQEEEEEEEDIHLQGQVRKTSLIVIETTH